MIFIGGINANAQPSGGEEAKNQQIVAFIKKNNIPATIIDTHNWKKRVLTLCFQILRALLLTRNKQIYLSLSRFSTHKLMRICNFLGISRRNTMHYFVIGGVLHNWLFQNKQYINTFITFDYIYAESKKMTESLKYLGLKNTIQVPNFKSIPNIKIKKSYDCINFVFLSRIIPDKGCELIIDATTSLNKKGYKNYFDVSFYGNFDNSIDNDYELTFLNRIKKIENISYKGFLKLNEIENFNLLAKYNAMLFPTYWKGEGYPGVLIDAFISALPVIASDWNHNKEIVMHYKNGLIIIPKNYESLANAMEELIKNKPLLQTLEKGAKESIKDYNIDLLLPNIIKP